MAVTRRALITAAGVGALGLAGCSSSAPRSTASRTRRNVTMVAGAAILGREAAVAVATDKGYFRDAGLGTVTLIPGQATAGNLTLLASGKVDVAAVDMSEALGIRDRGGYADWRIVMAVQQRYTGCLLSLIPDLVPGDLPGKTIAGIKGGANVGLFPLYAKLAGFDPGKVKWVYVAATDLIKTLAAHAVDVVTQQTLGRATAEVATGKPVTVLPYSDYLFDLYGNAIAVRVDTIRREPGMVKAFLGAYARGLEWMCQHPAPAAEIFTRTQPPPANVQAAQAEITILANYALRSGLPVGGMTQERVARAVALVRGGGLIASSPDPDQIVDWRMVPGGGQ